MNQKNNIDWGVTTDKDWQNMKEFIRPIDAYEITKSSGMALDELFEYTKALKCYALRHDGFLLAIFGVNIESSDGKGMPWLYSTVYVEKFPMAFLRASRPISEELFSDVEYLSNLVYYKNTIAMQWLRWLGFTFNDDLYEMNGEYFYFFERKKSCAVQQ